MFGNKINSKDISTPVSYRLRVSIYVDWINLIIHFFPELRDESSAWDFVEKLMNDTELNIDKEKSLFGKAFEFTQFYDDVSGLTQIWSCYYNNFVRDLLIVGAVFEAGFLKFRKKFPNNKIAAGIEIKPEYIGFRSILPDGAVVDGDKISQIPFWEIIWFFTKTYRKVRYDTSDYEVKKFPQSLQEQFDKYLVKYQSISEFDFEEDVNLLFAKNDEIVLRKANRSDHEFKARFHSVYIEMEFFEGAE